MKLSDYIADFIACQGVGHVFLVTGAHILHTVDSVARHSALKIVPCAHEQGAAFAADAYARVSGGLGICMSTSGPGAVNLLSGACSAYFDGVSLLLITGQVATPLLKKSAWNWNDGIPPRQLGFQETDVVSIFRAITKAATCITNSQTIRFFLERAVWLAREGRAGPVLLDLPDDIQRADVEPERQMNFLCPAQDVSPVPNLIEVSRLFAESERPVVVIGAGARTESIRAFIDKLGCPAVLTWGAMDILPYGHPLNAGGFGICGPVAGNLTVQKADLVLALGCRLSSQMVGAHGFAANAKLVTVELESPETTKLPLLGVKPYLIIKSDVGAFLSSCDGLKWHDRNGWLDQVRSWRRAYPPGYHGNTNGANPYVFLAALSHALRGGEVILTDAGATLAWTMQALQVKEGQRLISSWNHSPMGWALPASIGAAFAAPGRMVICLTGDGSFQMNIQELATIVRHNLNIKVFVFDNSGYGIIRQTQDAWLEARHFASCPEGGLGEPDLAAVSRAYGLACIKTSDPIAALSILQCDGPAICILKTDPAARITPKLKGGSLGEIVPDGVAR